MNIGNYVSLAFAVLSLYIVVLVIRDKEFRSINPKWSWVIVAFNLVALVGNSMGVLA